MKSSNRDLLLLSTKSLDDHKEIELEVKKLDQLLFHAESMENFCKVNEIIDINNYKIISDPSKIERIVTRKKLKHFQFINNKN